MSHSWFVTETDNSPYFEAIAAAPESDAPRIALAEHLTAQGDPRGEFILIQCEQEDLSPARMTARGIAPTPHQQRRWQELHERQRELFQQYGSEWTKPFTELGVEVEFRRGFADRFIIPPDHVGQILENSESLSAISSTVRSVSLANDHGHRFPVEWHHKLASNLFRMPLMQRIRRLTCLGDWGPHIAHYITSTDELHSLEELEFHGSSLVADDLVELLNSEKLSSLRVLSIHDGSLGNQWLGAIAPSAPQFQHLKTLSLQGCAITDHGASLIAQNPAFQSLNSLFLGGQQFSEKAIRELLQSPHLQRTSLWLDVNHLPRHARQLLSQELARHNGDAVRMSSRSA